MDPQVTAWARQHRRLSAGAIRRRFPITREQAERWIAGLLAGGVLHPKPEGDSYRVRYPRPAKTERWLRPHGEPYTYSE